VGAAVVILLDTNVLIDLHLYRLDPDELYGASMLSRAELEFGVNAAPSMRAAGERLARLHDLDALFDWIEFDLASTRSYGIVAHRARVSGARVRGKDALIAAQAHRHGAAVMTENVDDFEPFSHLVEIVRPSRL